MHALRTSLVVGSLATVTGLALGVPVALGQPASWTAHATVLILPVTPGANPDALAGYYDTLSRGNVPATYVALLDAGDPAPFLDTELDLAGGELEGRSLAFQVVTDTSVIDVAATAASPEDAEETADAAARWAQESIAQMGSPYQGRVVGTAEGTASLSSIATGSMVTVMALVALAAGVVAQQVAYRLLRRRVAPDVVGHLVGPVPQTPASRRTDRVAVTGGPDDGG
ncbi:hypothetical protein ACFP6A_04300 [Quadrisphaera sp. GCM10027208]|uniref:hypothetical protein n=1 Tax=Quadrisphaera sp. GCM10027208 TaxID=3273423 RepID=UPI00361DBD5B